MRSGTPLATSPLESGIPRVSTPGTFRPCAFSALRRFSPPAGLPVLFHTGATYGVQRAWTTSPGDALSGVTISTPKGECRVGCVRDTPSKTERETLLSTGVSSIGAFVHGAHADIPLWTVIGFTSQAPSHSPITPRTEQRGGGPNEDQPTAATQKAMPYALPGSMRPLLAWLPRRVSELARPEPGSRT